LKNIPLKDWGAFLLKIGLISSEHDFTWIQNPDLEARNTGLQTLLLCDASLERNEQQPPLAASPTLFITGLSMPRSARLRPYVEAKQAVYDLDKVIELLIEHYAERLCDSIFNFTLPTVPSPRPRSALPH
jgi:hypothetical protein